MDAQIPRHSVDRAKAPASVAQMGICDHHGCYVQNTVPNTTSVLFNTQLPRVSSTGPALHYEVSNKETFPLKHASILSELIFRNRFLFCYQKSEFKLPAQPPDIIAHNYISFEKEENVIIVTCFALSLVPKAN